MYGCKCADRWRYVQTCCPQSQSRPPYVRQLFHPTKVCSSAPAPKRPSPPGRVSHHLYFLFLCIGYCRCLSHHWQCSSFGGRPISLGIASSGFIHAVACVSISCLLKAEFHCVYVPRFVYPFVPQCVPACVHLLALVNSGAVSVGVQLSWMPGPGNASENKAGPGPPLGN